MMPFEAKLALFAALMLFTFTPFFARVCRVVCPYVLHIGYDPITGRKAVWFERRHD